MTGRHDGRSVVVTGAAGGIGRGIALACAAEGAFVVVADRRDEGVETVAEIERAGGAAAWVHCDVSQRADVDATVKVAVDKTGGLDAIVHNATSPLSSVAHPIEGVDADAWEEHVSVSLRGAYHCARASIAALSERRGSMIVMTSAAGMEGSAALPVYAALKAGLRGFTKSLAREWGPLGVRINAVSPLAMTSQIESAVRQDPALADRLATRIPLGRVGDPESDLGPAIAFLVSPAAHYITGQTLVVDGGRFMNL